MKSAYRILLGLAIVAILGACAPATTETTAGQSVGESQSDTRDSSGGGSGGSTTSTTQPREDLFALGDPDMVDVTPTEGPGGELITPDFCKPNRVGLARYGAGFLLVADFNGAVPPLGEPPRLDYGVLFHYMEFNLGVWSPGMAENLGGSYKINAHYQTKDRPPLEQADLGGGKAEPDTNIDIQIQGSQVRVALPDSGPNTDDISEWGVSVTCALRHPVDSFYFVSNRVPPNRFDRIPLGRAVD